MNLVRTVVLWKRGNLLQFYICRILSSDFFTKTVVWKTVSKYMIITNLRLCHISYLAIVWLCLFNLSTLINKYPHTNDSYRFRIHSAKIDWPIPLPQSAIGLKTLLYLNTNLHSSVLLRRKNTNQYFCIDDVSNFYQHERFLFALKINKLCHS